MNKLLTIIMLLVTNPIYATTYYVDCKNGHNGNSGTSHANAWKTTSKVNSSVRSTGDDVYFKAGCTWNKPLVISWGGAKSNRANIGSYYMKSGVETIGVPSGTEYPTFQGTCISKKNCPFNTASSVPSRQWNPLINIKGNYITVKKLRTKNSSGVGISIFGNSKGKQKFNNNYILNNKIEHALNNGIVLNRTSHTNVVKGNSVTRAAVIKPYGFNNNWPAAVGLANSHNNIIEKNTIFNTFGEGIGVFSNSNNNIIRNNLITKGNKAGIYISCSLGNIIESNKVLGDRTDSFLLIKNNYPSTGAYIAASETYCKADTSGNIFRNNLAANVGKCFGVGIEKGAIKAGYEAHNEFYNNSCVNAYIGFSVNSQKTKGKASMVSKNNIITDVAIDCRLSSDSASKFNHNQFDTPPSASRCLGSNNVYGKPRLNVTSGWNNVGIKNVPTDTSFNVKSNSITINAGISLSSANALRSSRYTQSKLLSSCAFDLSKNARDRKCKKRLSPDSIGAFANN